MSKVDYRLVELHQNNIRSFDGYLPRRAAIRIVDEDVFGWGVVAEDYASGLILCEKNHKTNELWILWLYVDEAVRGSGIANRLYEEALSAAGDVDGIVCEYLFPMHAGMEDFLLHKGFSLFTKREEGLAEDEDEVHMARLSIADPLSDDAWVMTNKPMAGYQMPRLLALRGYLQEMGLPAVIAVPANGDPGICVERESPLLPVDIFVLPDVEDPERYTITLRIAVDVEADETDRAKAFVEKWEQEVSLVSVHYDTEDDTVEFVAMMPVESGLPEQEIFADFFTAYAQETDELLEEV